ncbi:hypothetical protein ACFL3F_03935 [Planctomycetota bacterium]
MIKTRCAQCHTELAVSLKQVGQTVTCPACSAKFVFSPAPSDSPTSLPNPRVAHRFKRARSRPESDIFEAPPTETDIPVRPAAAAHPTPPTSDPLLDGDLLDLSPESTPTSAQASVKHSPTTPHATALSEDAFQAGPSGATNDSEADAVTPVAAGSLDGVRPFPWLLDIWLYPLCHSTLIMGAILVGGPIALAAIGALSWGAVMLVPIILPFSLVVIFLCIIGLVLMALYLVWYICECVRDSSQGHVRAPDTVNNTPGQIELLGQSATIVISTLLCWLPAMLCFFYQAPPVWCWSALALVAYVYPMVFLRCVIYESFAGLNIFALPTRILRTFIPYTGVALIMNLYLAGLCRLSILLAPVLGINVTWAWAICPLCLLVPIVNLGPLYLTLVLAHLLGTFYSRYEASLL